MPNHTMGVISTPKAGGMLPRRTLRSGSVGHATMFQGDSFKFVVGYQERTTRHNYVIKMERERDRKCECMCELMSWGHNRKNIVCKTQMQNGYVPWQRIVD